MAIGVKELAELLGVSAPTAYRMIASKKIPRRLIHWVMNVLGTKPEMIFEENEIQDWIAGGRKTEVQEQSSPSRIEYCSKVRLKSSY